MRLECLCFVLDLGLNGEAFSFFVAPTGYDTIARGNALGRLVAFSISPVRAV